MSSMRDAMKRLETIYNECAPEAIEQNREDAALDEFSRLRKNVHTQLRTVRQQLRDREEMMARGGTTSESAETSYRIRVAIKSTKEQAARMQEIVDKEARKKKKDKDGKHAEHKECLELCKQHIDECENLEKRKHLDATNADRTELLSGAPVNKYNSPISSGSGNDPFTHTDLPDIDVEEDFKAIKTKTKEIVKAILTKDNDMNEIGAGVAKLKEIALEMGQELDRQDEVLDRVDVKVEAALDHVDNINVQLKKSLDGIMKGDRFMVNCILMCVLLALIAFISTQFVSF